MQSVKGTAAISPRRRAVRETEVERGKVVEREGGSDIGKKKREKDGERNRKGDRGEEEKDQDRPKSVYPPGKQRRLDVMLETTARWANRKEP